MASFPSSLLCAALLGGARAANPVGGKTPADYVPGMADPHMHFFDGQFLMFATHDFSVNNTGFKMTDWWVWSSPDAVTWAKESVITPKVSLKWDKEADECWAVDAAFVDGTYYFYVSVGPEQIAVMTAPSPKGPWADPLGQPLLSKSFGRSLNPPATFRDPAVFEDPDTKEHFLIAGVFDYYITKLSPDMVSFAEAPKLVNFTNDVYGPCGAGKTDDKAFLHKNGDTFYLSWGCFYATGPTVYGPYTMQGSVIDKDKIADEFQCDGQAHQCGNEGLAAPRNSKSAQARAAALAEYDKQGPQPWYLTEDYTDRHGSFLKHGNQWYYSSNDRSHSQAFGGREGYFRNTVLCYIHFRADGTMEPCTIDATGVGQYDGGAGKAIEAENFFELTGSNARKVDLAGPEAAVSGGSFIGFAVGAGDGTMLRYPHVAGAASAKTMTLRVVALSPSASTVEVRANTASGPVLATCEVPAAASLAFQDIACAVMVPEGEDEMDVIMSVRGEASGELLQLDSFWFEEGDLIV